MILSAVFSKPSKNIDELLERPYIKARIWRKAQTAVKGAKNSGKEYGAEFFTKTQAFQKSMGEDEVNLFIEKNAGTSFKNAVVKTESEEITFLANRRGEVKKISRKIKAQMENISLVSAKEAGGNKIKNYILKEGTPVPFLVKLGVMTKEGAVVSAKYSKFRQINRFLEYVRDIIPEVKALYGKDFTAERPLRIADFGCGKSYLTFAVYYYLTEIERLPAEIVGLDLKEGVIKECQKLAAEFGYEKLNFFVGNIADFSYKNKPDVIITLHACDTATDFALNFAVRQNAFAILSVPCCQHEINLQLEKNKAAVASSSPFASLERWGIVRERFAALATDVIRAELLEQSGYAVQLLEFIDMEHTPKNILLRAVRKRNAALQNGSGLQKSSERLSSLMQNLGASQTLANLLAERGAG